MWGRGVADRAGHNIALRAGQCEQLQIEQVIQHPGRAA